MNTSSLDIGPYDPYNDMIEIEGVRYSGELLRDGLGVNGINAGKSFRIVNRNKGVITIQSLPGLDELLDLVSEANTWFDECGGCSPSPDTKLQRARTLVTTLKLTGGK